MQRIKILTGAILAIVCFLVFLTSSVIKPESAVEAMDVKSELERQRAVVAQREAKQYKKYQEKLHAALKAYFERAITSGDIVGAGVSIVKGDSIVIADGFGKRKIGLKKEVNGETVFRLGSLSKGFTGVLAADLKKEGKLTWEDKVNDHLPEFRLGDMGNTQKITLGHILSHTSGTPYHSFTNLVEAGLPLSTIAGRFGEVSPISEPGAMYSYQNAMFALSSEIMYKVTGQKIDELLTQRFFEPLAMKTATSDCKELMDLGNVALPHTRIRKGWRSRPLTDSYQNAIAAGGINASSLDMAKWMRFLLGHNPEVMQAKDIAQAFIPRIEINIGRKYYKRWPGHLSSHYGFGWRIHEFADDNSKQQTVWHHGGSVNNFRNEIAIYPESDMGICVLLNSNSRIAKTVIPDLYGIVERINKEHTSEIAEKEAIPTTASL